MTVKQRYEGIQTVLLEAGNSACLFLCILSIAEQYLNKDIDFIWAYNILKSTGCVTKDFYMLDQEKALFVLTEKTWRKAEYTALPDVVPAKMYTVEKWYCPKTGFTHFKRRAYDTLESSNTVKHGKLIAYYTYIVE